MPYVTSFERVGVRKGIAIGKEEGKIGGKIEGAADIVLRMLSRRFGALDAAVQSQVRGLSLPQIEALSDCVHDLVSLADLQTWLLNNPPPAPANGEAANGALPMES